MQESTCCVRRGCGCDGESGGKETVLIPAWDRTEASLDGTSRVTGSPGWVLGRRAVKGNHVAGVMAADYSSIWAGFRGQS